MEKPTAASSSGAVLKPGAPAWLAVGIACLCSFMVVFDGAVLNLALPAMQQQLQLSNLAQQWVIDAYLLVLGGFMLVSARASDWFGRARVLSWGIVVFTVASAWAGMSESAASLLSARALQGAGASALATSTLAIIVTVYSDPQAKARAISIWAASSSLAVAIGVVAGGLLTSFWGWRAVMWLNLPIGVALWLAVQACLQTRRGTSIAMVRLDWRGSLSIVLAMASTLWFLNQLQVAAAGVQLALYGVLCVSAWLLFIWLERRQPEAVVPLHLFRLPAVSQGNFVVLGMGAVLTGSHYFISHFLQWQLQQSAWAAALSMLPLPLSLAAAAMLARYAMDKGWRYLPSYGGVLAALGLLMLSYYSAAARPGAGGWLFNCALLVLGLGLGMMLMTATHTALALLSKEVAGLAAGLFNSARQLGAALGIAILSLVLHSQSAPAGYSWVFAAAAGWIGLVALAARGLAQPHSH